MIQAKKIIVNVHIEKTAGTSLLKFFEQTLGKERVAFYDPKTDSIIKVSDLLVSPSNSYIDKSQLKSYAFWPIIKGLFFTVQSHKRYRNTVPEGVAVIHGHFTADRFDSILPGAISTIVIRDPLARMQSQYNHWKRAKGRSQWRVMIPFNPDMKFEEYALLPEMKNYQVVACAGKDLRSFTIVGLTEQLETFTENLHSLFISEGLISQIIPYMKVKNMNQNKKAYESITSSFEKTFYNFHKDDYVLYEQAKSLAH